MPNILDPKTGRTGSISHDDIQRAISDGYQLADPLGVYDPETQRTGTVAPENVGKALQDGLLPVGSHAHKVATTGKLESFGRSAAQGFTLDHADELMGALKGLFTDKTYTEARDEYRANDAIAKEANPGSSLAGTVLGSIGSSVVTPGLGIAKGASLLRQAGVGAALGAITGSGASEADLTEGDVGGYAKDIAKGGAIGGGLGLATGALGEGYRVASDATKRGVGRFFDPTLNRLAAAGATVKGIKNAGGLEEMVPLVEKATARGVFRRNEKGLMPTPREVLKNIEDFMSDDIKGMYKLMANAPTENMNPEHVWLEMEPKFRMLIEQADPMQRGEAETLLKHLESEFMKTGGDIPNLWQLKKNSGGWANWTADSPLQNEMKKLFNQDLNTLVVDSVDDIAKRMKIDGLGELNDNYSTMITLRDYLDQVVDKDLITGGPSAFKMTDYVRSSAIGAGVGSMLGMPIVGGAAGIVGMAGGAAIRSNTGRLARAKIGETMGLAAEGLAQKTQANAAAMAQGAIARNVQGVRDWIQQMGPNIPPQFAATAQKIMRLPDSAAEAEIRMLLPLIDPMLTPSPFMSEFNGRVTSPQDRILASKVTKSRGLPPSRAAEDLNKVNKGQLLDYHYSSKVMSHDEEMLAFNERVTAMLYGVP